MAHSIDFILPSCYGLPESMWIAASAMLDTTIQRCWFLLGTFVVVKMLVRALSELGKTHFSLATHLKIIARAFLIAIFLHYYKNFLMTFDYFIDSLSLFEKHRLPQPSVGSEKSLGISGTVGRFLLDRFKHFMFFLTQEGAVRMMHYVKSVVLLILAQLGPFAALFSLLPGIFSASFKTWARGYINVSCWGVTLAIVDMLAVHLVENVHTGSATAQVVLSFSLFIATLFTPLWTSYLINRMHAGGTSINTLLSPNQRGDQQSTRDDPMPQ